MKKIILSLIFLAIAMPYLYLAYQAKQENSKIKNLEKAVMQAEDLLDYKTKKLKENTLSLVQLNSKLSALEKEYAVFNSAPKRFTSDDGNVNFSTENFILLTDISLDLSNKTTPKVVGTIKNNTDGMLTTVIMHGQICSDRIPCTYVENVWVSFSDLDKEESTTFSVDLYDERAGFMTRNKKGKRAIDVPVFLKSTEFSASFKLTEYRDGMNVTHEGLNKKAELQRRQIIVLKDKIKKTRIEIEKTESLGVLENNITDAKKALREALLN